MGFINARGSNFYYEEQGDGPPILLIPPAGSTASTWGTLVGDLAGAGRIIAYDRRGYTRSGARLSARPPSMRAMPPRSWTHWKPGRRWWSGRAPGRPSRWTWRSVGRTWSARSSSTRQPGGRCGTRTRRAWARWPECSGWPGEAATRRQPKRFCAGSTATVTVAARGTPSPNSGGALPERRWSGRWNRTCMPSFNAPARWVRDMGSQAGSHANIAQFENTDINREDARNGHRPGKRSASDCNQANS